MGFVLFWKVSFVTNGTVTKGTSWWRHRQLWIYLFQASKAGAFRPWSSFENQSDFFHFPPCLNLLAPFNSSCLCCALQLTHWITFYLFYTTLLSCENFGGEFQVSIKWILRRNKSFFVAENWNSVPIIFSGCVKSLFLSKQIVPRATY